MKFAIFLQHYFPYGGLQRDALRLAEAAKEAGDEPTLIVSSWNGPKPTDIPIKETASGGISNHDKAKRFEADCHKLMDSGIYDTAICFSRVSKTPYHFCGDPCFLDRFLKKKPSIAKFLPRYRYLLSLENAIFGSQSSTHIFFLAQSEIPPYQQHYPLPKERWTLLPPWLKKPKSRQQDKKNITDELGIPPDSPILLMVGSDFHRKGLDRAIRAVSLYQNLNPTNTNIPKLHLIACGQDNPTAYNKLAEKLKIKDQVHILGPRDDIPELMSAADILIHPARQETAGMVLLEAITHKLPVLCTECCGYSPHVKETGCPIIPNDADASHIAQLIHTTLQSHSTLSEQCLLWSQQSGRYNTAQLILDKLRSNPNMPRSERISYS